MSLKIITNNPTVLGYMNNNDQSTVFVSGHAKAVIEACCHWIYDGWILAADPLAGHFSRPNPFHTMFLQKNGNGRIKGEDLVRLERTLKQWDRYENVIPMTEKLWNDYGELDYSIAVNTFEGLVKNPVFYNCIDDRGNGV